MRPQAANHHSPKTIDSLYKDVLSDFEDSLKQEGRSTLSSNKNLGTARHFLVWLGLQGIPLESVDEAALLGYRDHHCDCFAWKNGSRGKPRRHGRDRFAIKRAMRFVEFLEDTGRIKHPDERLKGNRFLEQFIGECKTQGFRSSALRCRRDVSQHFLVWLHRSRISMKAVNADVVERFLHHDCLCSNRLRTPKKYVAAGKYAGYVGQFVSFLTRQGVVPSVPDVPEPKSEGELDAFCTWLEQNRGLRPETIRAYRHTMTSLLPDLGTDPTQYDAASIRRVLLDRFPKVSQYQAQLLTRRLRMYLRFLSSTGACPAALSSSLLAPRSYQFSKLPRYISMGAIERIIATCDTDTEVGTRDRAVLLLLARLGLRAGDVWGLRLSDIDWENAQIQVWGKSKRPAKLPLPQDVGDALLQYIVEARPRVEATRVFLRSMAPHTPFTSSGAISAIVSRAVTRAGVAAPGGHGAHLLRHSIATHMLRSGVSMDLIGALLRHESQQTTMLYAKTDTSMLQEVAQPWLGGAR